MVRQGDRFESRRGWPMPELDIDLNQEPSESRDSGSDLLGKPVGRLHRVDRRQNVPLRATSFSDSPYSERTPIKGGSEE
jgi:hypothetical protein